MKKALTKERVKLPGFCPTNETVDFILKYASKDGSHDSGYSISARGDTKQTFTHPSEPFKQGGPNDTGVRAVQ